jgi:hypothetical protein
VLNLKHLPPGGVELYKEEIVFGKFFVEVGVSEDEYSVFFFGGGFNLGKADSGER